MSGYTNQVQQIAKEHQLGSRVGRYTYSGFGKYLVATWAVCLFVLLLIVYAGALNGAQGWLCLALMAAGTIFVCALAFLARNWGIYEYDQGIIINQGRDVRIVVWDEIVSLEKASGITTAQGAADNTVTYSLSLKQSPNIILTADYHGISHLIATIEGKLAKAKRQAHPNLELSNASPPMLSRA